MGHWRPFTAEEDAIIVRCRLIGATYREIGDRLGREGGVVAIYARRTRLVEFTPKVEQTKRKNKRLVTILKMWNAGATGSQIGAVVGLLRGEVHREIAGAREVGLFARRIGQKEFNRRVAVGQSLYDRAT